MCGLYGIINTKPEVFDRATFSVLGIGNDRRGGDSCGVFIDGEVEYGIGKISLFENFLWSSDLIEKTTKCQVALGHDRKASVGAITVEKAHPILIKDETGKIVFAFVHNGTLYNYEELAKKYIPEIDYKGCSDSQILALIIYHKGFDVLSEYNGGAAFVAVDYRLGKPVTYLFKGASKYNAYAKEATEERPLYFVYNSNRLVFSSIASYLFALFGDNVFEATNNRLYQYIGGKLFTYKDIDRSNAIQTKQYVYPGVLTKPTAVPTTYDYPYINYDEAHNVYGTDKDKELLHGKYKVASYGRVLKGNNMIALSPTARIFTVFFFNGIPFRDKFSFNIVNKAYKKSGMEINDFVNKNQAFVRFHAASKQFFDGSMWRVAVSEFGHTPFSGSIPILGRTTVRDFNNGRFSSTHYTGDYISNFQLLNLQ